MKKNKKQNLLTVLWYAHPRVAIALLLVMVNLAVIFLFTGVLALIKGASFFGEMAYVFTFTMCSDGIYDFINSNEDVICFIIKLVLVVIQMVIFSGALIGFTTDVLQTTIDKRLKNLGKMKLKDHYVFLNWSSVGPRIIYDLSFLEGDKNVVILAEGDREAILNSIQNVFTENKRKMKNLTVFIKEGDPLSPKHLEDVSLANAKYVGVLLSDIEKDESQRMTANDLNALKSLFSIMHVNVKANIVVEVEENETVEKIEKLLNTIDQKLNERIIVFSHSSVMGHIIGRSLVNPIYSTLYHELLSYDGVEFYAIPSMPVEEAFKKFNNCLPIVNYDDDDVVDENGKREADQLYVLAENKEFSRERKVDINFVKPLTYKETNPQKPFTVFVLSPDKDAKFVRQELVGYSKLTGVKIDCKCFSYDEDIEVIRSEIKNTKGEKKVLLMSSGTSCAGSQDTNVFLAALDIKTSGFGEDTAVYSEIANPSNLNALRNLGVVSVIVTNRLISLFMVQLLTHPGSKKFYRDIISSNVEGGTDAIDLEVVKAQDVLEFEKETLEFTSQAEFVQSFYHATGKAKTCMGVQRFGEELQNIRFFCSNLDEPENLVINKKDQLILVCTNPNN